MSGAGGLGERHSTQGGGGIGQQVGVLQACLVPVGTADEATKTILNSSRALIASRDGCHCPWESNTTGWVCKRRREQRKREEYVEKIHRAASRSPADAQRCQGRERVAEVSGGAQARFCDREQSVLRLRSIHNTQPTKTLTEMLQPVVETHQAEETQQ